MAQSDDLKAKKNTSKDYRKVNVPEPMANKIDEIIRKNKEWGFRSLDDFVREAIRASIIRYSQTTKEQTLKGD